jgi:quercetin dioxygenase-like cupin family protein
VRKVRRYFAFLIATLSIWLVPAALFAGEPEVRVEQVLKTVRSWDGSNYTSYPSGQPEVTVLKITIPPNTTLHWHRHPMISAAYVLSGHLTVEKKDTGERKVVRTGEALAETVETTHRGFTTDEAVELIVFYAGRVDLPVSVTE